MPVFFFREREKGRVCIWVGKEVEGGLVGVRGGENHCQNMLNEKINFNTTKSTL